MRTRLPVFPWRRRSLAALAVVLGFLACRDASAPDDGSNSGAVPPRDSQVVTTPPRGSAVPPSPPRDSIVWSIESGANQIGRINTELPAEFVVRATHDVRRTPLSGLAVASEMWWTNPRWGRGPLAVVTPDTTRTDADGRARFRVRMGGSTAQKVLVLQHGGRIVASDTFDVLPGPAITAQIVRAPLPSLPQRDPLTVPLGTLQLARADTDAVVMAGLDEYGNLAGPVAATWTSSAPAVAPVNSFGQVTGLAPGNATITGASALGGGTMPVAVDSASVTITRVTTTRYDFGVSIGSRMVLVSATGAVRLLDSATTTDEQAPLGAVHLLVGSPDGTLALLDSATRKIAIRRPTGAWLTDSVPMPHAPVMAGFVGGDLMVWSVATAANCFNCYPRGQRVRRGQAGGWSAMAADEGSQYITAVTDANGQLFFPTIYYPRLSYALRMVRPGVVAPEHYGLAVSYSRVIVIPGFAGGVARAMTTTTTRERWSVYALSATSATLDFSFALPLTTAPFTILAGSDTSVTWWDGTRFTQWRRGASVTRTAPAVVRYENLTSMPDGLIRVLTVGPDGAVYASRNGSGTYRIMGLRPPANP
jgi:hypothetical protein